MTKFKMNRRDFLASTAAATVMAGVSMPKITFAADNVYQNVIAGFKIWWVSGIYIAAQVFLGLHMYHGLWSMFQSLGWSGESGGRDWRRLFSASFATVVAVGNISFPVSVQLGLGG